jgi:hypothetical protein
MNKCVFIPYDINKSTHLKYTIQNRVAVAKFENGGGGLLVSLGVFWPLLLCLRKIYMYVKNNKSDSSWGAWAPKAASPGSAPDRPLRVVLRGCIGQLNEKVQLEGVRSTTSAWDRSVEKFHQFFTVHRFAFTSRVLKSKWAIAVVTATSVERFHQFSTVNRFVLPVRFLSLNGLLGEGQWALEIYLPRSLTLP